MRQQVEVLLGHDLDDGRRRRHRRTTKSTESTGTNTTDAGTSQTTTTGLAPELARLMSKNCRQLLNLSQAFAMAMTGAQSDIGETAKLMDKFAAGTPEEVRDDFKVLSVACVKIARALKGLDLTSGKAPSAEMIAKLSQISTEIDSAKVSEASQHISTWAQKNCSGG
jgi:hypothetical protein